MSKVIIEARRGSEFLDIPLIPYKNSLASAWVKEIASLQQKKAEILERDRIYSLNLEWSEETIFEHLKRCWDVLASFDVVEGKFPKIDGNQDSMNRLHVLFEGLIGLDTQRSEIFQLYPKEFCDSVVQLNVLIHRYESLRRHKGNSDYGRIVVTFREKNKRAIEDDQLTLFTDRYLPGDVVVNYCHVGKPVLDYIIDNDEHISSENIVPQSNWCGDFMLFFCGGPGHSELFQKKVEVFWKQKSDFMASLGLHRDDPKLAFGRIPVARTEEDPRDLKKRIFGITEIVGVRVESD